MKQELLEKCQLFVENKNVIEKKFAWDSMMIMPVCAFLYTEKNMQIDADKMKACRKLLKGKAGIFSDLRSYSELVLLSKMALCDSPVEYLEQTMSAYDLIKKYKMSGSSFASIAAMLLVDYVDVTEWDEMLKKAQMLYAGMKKNHPFLTGAEDISFAILMAMSDLPVDLMLTEAEACYKLLSKTFSASDGTQSLSHLLSVNTQESSMKCTEVLELHRMFKAKKRQFNNTGIVLYGSLNMLDVDRETIIEEIIEVDEYLKVQKGFGFFGMDAQQRLMYATMLVMGQYNIKNREAQVSIVSSVIGAIIAEYTALLAVAAMMTTVAVTSN